MPLAMTECHFALPGRNRCDVLSTWAAGVANARLLNVHERHGDLLKIATLADFCGTRWQVNAIMIPVPGGESYMMPVALVMALYRHHTGEQAVGVTKAPDGLDVTASRTGDRVFLHVVNTNRDRSVTAKLAIEGTSIRSGRDLRTRRGPGIRSHRDPGPRDQTGTEGPAVGRPLDLPRCLGLGRGVDRRGGVSGIAVHV